MADFDELIGTLTADGNKTGPVAGPFWLALCWFVGGVLYLAIALVISGLRPDWASKLHDLWLLAETGALLAIFVTTTLSGALLAFPDMYQRPRLAALPYGFLALFVLVIALAWQADTPPAPLPAHSFECTLSITLMALLPCVWTFAALRRYACTHSRQAGAIAMLSAFSIGALWLRLHELNDSMLHLIAWHYLPMALFGLLGVWLGRRVLHW